MHIGTQLMTFGEAPLVIYTPWFPKGADNGYFTYELIHQNFGAGGEFSVIIYTKNAEDPGSEGVATDTFPQFGGTQFFHTAATNLKQLIRFEITLTPGSEPTGQQGVIYRFLPPTWYDTAI